jgi:hypothetical protein
MRESMFVVEIKKGRRWIYRSSHKNELSAVANLEAVSKSKSVRIKQNGVVILESKIPK